MIDTSKHYDQLVQANEDLQRMCRLWIAANEQKSERIRELERECDQLRRRIFSARHYRARLDQRKLHSYSVKSRPAG